MAYSLILKCPILKNMSLSKLGDGEGQGSLVCCGPAAHGVAKELDMTE